MGYLKCKNCGSNSFRKIDGDSYECKYCGVLLRKKFAIIKEEKPTKNIEDFNGYDEGKNKSSNNSFIVLKLILCIFLGHFGVHRFIEGKVGTGLLFLFTHGLFGIGYICDIFRIIKELSSSNNQNNDIQKEGDE